MAVASHQRKVAVLMDEMTIKGNMLKSTLLGDTFLLNVVTSYVHTQRFFLR